MRESARGSSRPHSTRVISASELAALRAFHAGIESRAALTRYLPASLVPGVSARGVFAVIRAKLITAAESKHVREILPVLKGAGLDRTLTAKRLQRAVDTLEQARPREPTVRDRVDQWLPPAICAPLLASGLKTFAELTLGVPRLKTWWRTVPGIGIESASEIESFFAEHETLTQEARALLPPPNTDVAPLERFEVPKLLDGSRGRLRDTRVACVLSANTDADAIRAWLDLRENNHTRRAYCREAERLLLWSILERNKAMSSLTAEDATAYRAFLRRPSPKHRWIGAGAPRTSPCWRPFVSERATSSIAYSIATINAMFHWLVETRYLRANPFAGIRIRASAGDGKSATPTLRAFSDHEWALIMSVAKRLPNLGWSDAAAARMVFILEFAYATGLRNSELTHAVLTDIDDDGQGGRWISVAGKGSKVGRVVVPPLAQAALERYLLARQLPLHPTRWRKGTCLIARLDVPSEGISSSRLWAAMKRFFDTASDELEGASARLAARLREASPHWMRHSHATHAIHSGATLTTVRDNLRHASIATTSRYLSTDDEQRAAELRRAFGRARPADRAN
ncbi:phage integrase family protein [Pandoraea sp. PE-S2R-1]|uniref:phage integrase family protein n=1 Tax=Pandoraea sp. PE-S2R-1 TaxID=1986994 RepID=UPI000B4021F2|nr:phage integrase family protein [Pandoraea sp. PE-S2R-1]